MPYRLFLRAAAVAFWMMATPLYAHEFWIEPNTYQVEKSAKINAQNRVGQMLKGDDHPYLTSTFVDFSLYDSQGKRGVAGRMGDRPALNMLPRTDGLHVVAYESKPARTRYRIFEKFARKEGIAWVIKAHKDRDLIEENFREAYTRFAKSLIAVGDGAGRDRPVGFRFELVALNNPYTQPGPMEVELLFEGAPHPNAQIAIFRRQSEGKVTRTLIQTDAQGRATIPSAPHSMTLLSAVHMVRPSDKIAQASKRVFWHSLWASLTYRDPSR